MITNCSGVSGDGCGVTVEGAAPLVEDALENLSIADTKVCSFRKQFYY